MKKYGKWLLTAASCAAVLFGACACKQDENQKLPPPTEGEAATDGGTAGGNYGETYYANRDFNAYLLGRENTALKGQWNGGMKDPYIFKYDGTYYLYCSSDKNGTGVRAWQSQNLTDWVSCTAEGVSLGYVSKDRYTFEANAPEVYYIDGTFYMYLSNGTGHHVLTADSPTGPFAYAASFGDVGYSDGTLYQAADGKLFFLTSSDNGVCVTQMFDPLTLDISTRKTVLATRSSTFLGGNYATGAPCLFESDGVCYLFYSKVNPNYASYRTHYAAATQLDTSDTESFAKSFFNPLNGALLVNTRAEDGAVGTGSVSVVEAPDLNGTYIAYQGLNERNNYSLHIDRLLKSGAYLSVTSTEEKAIAPKAADHAVYGGGALISEGNLLLSKEQTKSRYTAELNGANVREWVFSYKSQTEYYALRTDYRLSQASVLEVKDGWETPIAQTKLFRSGIEASHTVKVENSDGVLFVSLDGITLFKGLETNADAGKVGYMTADPLSVGATAFSSLAKTDSDRAEITQAKGYTPAAAYMPDGRVENVNSYRLGEGSGVLREEDENNDFYGTDFLRLANMRDYARYLVRVNKEGRYALELILNAEFCNREESLGVALDDGDVLMCKTDKSGALTGYTRALTAEFDVAEGVKQLRIENLGNTQLDIVAFRLVSVSASAPAYSASLRGFAEKGIEYVTDWLIKENAHFAYGGLRQLAYVGDETITDFVMSVEMKLGLDAASDTSAGFAFHAGNFFESYDCDDMDSMQGYYLAVSSSTVTLRKCNYGDGFTLKSVARRTNPAEYYKYTVAMYGNSIIVRQNGELLFTVTDPFAFTTGRLALITAGAPAYYRNLTVAPYQV